MSASSPHQLRPRWRSAGRRRSTPHLLRRPERSGGWRPGDFLVSRGMGAAQGKKVDRRHCGTGDRGEAGLRPDQPIKEAAGSARSDREDQGEPGDSIVHPQGPAESAHGAHPASRRPAASILPMSRDRRATSPLPSRAWTFVARVNPAIERCPRPMVSARAGAHSPSNCQQARKRSQAAVSPHAGSRNGVRRAPRPVRSGRAGPASPAA